MNQLTTIPKLKSGNDEKVAKTLAKVIEDAKDGVRRILIAGFLLERIAIDLERGELEPWLEGHLEGFSRRSFFGWRELAKNVMEVVGIESATLLHFSTPMHEMLALPAAEVPKEQKEIRAKIDDLLDGKSYRQLMLGFKSTKQSGGFRPPKEEVQAWLKEHHPELAGTKYADLPEKIQKQFKKQFVPKTDPQAKTEELCAVWMDTLAELMRQADEKVYLHLSDKEKQESLKAINDIRNGLLAVTNKPKEGK